MLTSVPERLIKQTKYIKTTSEFIYSTTSNKKKKILFSKRFVCFHKWYSNDSN
jgi:hypothetical protein